MHEIVFLLIKVSVVTCHWKYLLSRSDWFTQKIPRSAECAPRSSKVIRIGQPFTGSQMKFFSSFFIIILIRLPICLMQDITQPTISSPVRKCLPQISQKYRISKMLNRLTGTNW